GFDHLAHVICASAILRYEVAKGPLVGATGACDGPLEVGEVPLRNGNCLVVVGDDDVDNPVGCLHVDWPDVLGLEGSEPSALYHRRAAHSDIGVGGGDDDIAASEQG